MWIFRRINTLWQNVLNICHYDTCASESRPERVRLCVHTTEPTGPVPEPFHCDHIARWSARSGTTGRSGTGVNTGARLRSGTVPVPKLWCEHGLSLESDSVIGNSLGTSMVTCRGLNSPNCVAAGIGGLPVSALRKGADRVATSLCSMVPNHNKVIPLMHALQHVLGPLHAFCTCELGLDLPRIYLTRFEVLYVDSKLSIIYNLKLQCPFVCVCVRACVRACVCVCLYPPPPSFFDTTVWLQQNLARIS